MVLLTRILLGNIVKKVRWFGGKSLICAQGGLGGTVSDLLGLTERGGCGGHGGKVCVTACDQAALEFSNEVSVKTFQAEIGNMSSEEDLLGAPGNDIDIRVPPGVLLQNEAGDVIADLNLSGEQIIIACGTAGCSAENSFTREVTEPVNVTAKLKHIADIGLVGFPDAGKSTLLNTVSLSTPVLSQCSYTPVQADIGSIEYLNHKVTIANLPDWKTVNFGVRHHFLSHLERTKMLLFVVDVYGYRLHHEHSIHSPINTIILLNKHIELYNESLLNKPCLLVLSKVDVEGGNDIAVETKEQLINLNETVEAIDPSWGVTPNRLVTFDEVIVVSAKERLNIDYLEERLRYWINEYESANQSIISNSIQEEADRKDRVINSQLPQPSAPPIDFERIFDSSVTEYDPYEENRKTDQQMFKKEGKLYQDDDLSIPTF